MAGMPYPDWIPFVHHGSSDLPCGAVFLYGERLALQPGSTFSLEHFRTPGGVTPREREEIRCPRCQEPAGADLFHQIGRLLPKTR